MIKSILNFLCYVNAKRYYFTSGENEVYGEVKKYEKKIKKNTGLSLFFLLALEKTLLAINFFLWTVIVMVFVFTYVFLFLPLRFVVKILLLVFCFIFNTPGARLKWLEKKAQEEKYDNNQDEGLMKSYKWQKRYRLALHRLHSSGKEKDWIGKLFDDSTYIKILERIRGIKKEKT